MKRWHNGAAGGGRRALVIALLLAALALLAAAPAALAQDEAPVAMPPRGDASVLYQTGGMPVDEAGGGLCPRGDAFDDYVARQLELCADFVDIARFGISVDNVCERYWAMLNSRPDLFYIDGTVRVWRSGNTAVKLDIFYRYPKSNIPAMKVKFDKETNRIIKFASAAITPLGKALLVNDYFCINYQYDYSYTIYDAYNLFTQETGVCNAYMLGYRHIMNKLGISSRTVTSESMNHTWNLIKVSGRWYHIDVTWNDPGEDNRYRALHKYFMCSNVGLAGHSGWAPATSATDTTYDDFFWQSVDVPIPVSGITMYYVDAGRGSHTLRKWTLGTYSFPKLCDFDAMWRVWGEDGRYWPGYYGLVGLYGGRVYFSTANVIYSVDAGGGEPRLAFVPDTSSGYIYGGYMYGNMVFYGIATSPNLTPGKANATIPTGQFLLPRSTVSIGAGAFENSALTWLDAGDGLRTIGPRAFAGCSRLTTVVMGYSVQSIADDAFAGCSPTFVCPSDSYAAEYAARKGFRVVSP